MIAPVVTTKRLILRTFSEADFERIDEIYARKETLEFMGGPRRKPTREGFVKMLSLYEKNAHGFGFWAVVNGVDNRVLGLCGIAPEKVDWGVEPHGLSYVIDPAYWGRGYATEAACAVRDLVFSKGIDRIVSIIAEGNERSVAVAKKAGMRYERDTGYKGNDPAYAGTVAAVYVVKASSH